MFGTFAYDGNAAGATPWDRMVPVGTMWGNDPTLTQATFSAGQRTAERDQHDHPDAAAFGLLGSPERTSGQQGAVMLILPFYG